MALAQIGPLPLSRRTKRFIVIAERDGGNRERVTDGSYDAEPAWSPDGGEIYFTRLAAWQPGAESEIYAIDLETRSLRRLTENDVLDRLPDPRPTRRSLPAPPEPRNGDVVVPDLVGRHVLFEDERRRFRELGLRLRAVAFPTDEGVLAVVREQVPRGGSRVPEGTVVKVLASDLSLLYAGSAFSARVWKAHPDCEEDTNPRGPMYKDLVRRVLRRGMSRERVFSLLGDPENSDGRASDWPLGRRSLIRIDCIYFRVEFDRRGRATRFYQWQS